ncbi:MAG: diaminopimelate decarboxylase [Meiothermus sp.]|uniref:diaminopimelate decarboxylase n=2 Tax=Meiothermus sp. TaxID=1955249 RepID=UPI0025EDB5C6|nr:diaminopimelate decarboxylase [Meiothermus sp.]MCS7068595.1 diaminopimelate decarboxylase [Meiothermus sp.]MDW8425055.1 diaminopimelate decarboxylase [Meiothermus sp.]
MSMSQSYTALRPEFREALREAARHFPTPFYAYDLAVVLRQLERLQKAFPGAEIFYAMKANPRLGLLRRLLERGVFVEAVSLGEVLRAYKAGFQRNEVLLNGPLKTPAVLEELSRAGLPMLGLDSLADLRRAIKTLPKARVLLRVNPDLPVATHDHLATGRGESKFGILPEEIGTALELARRSRLEVLGLHLHLGSALEHPQDYQAGFRVMDKLYQTHGPFQVMNLGGGFGLGLDLGELGAQAVALARQHSAELWLEPGRYLVAEAGVLVTRCWGVKRTRRNYLLIDAGMSQLIRPMLYGAMHPVEPLYKSPLKETYDLAGPACESGDVLARDVTLPEPKEGDLLAILLGGAYASSMSSNYLDTPRPAELLWDGQNWEVIRRQQSWEALLAEEL